MLSLGALNSIYASVLVPLTAGWLHSQHGHGGAALIHPLYLLAGSLLLAWGGGKLGHALYGRMTGDDRYAFLFIVGLVLFMLAMAKLLKLSVPLTLLLAGVVFKYQDVHPRGWQSHFGSAGSILIVVMIVSLGLPLKASDWMIGGIAAVVLVLARCVAKLAGTVALGSFSGLSVRQSVALGLALGPMSGLSWLLMHDTAGLYPQTGAPLAALILCTLAIQQIVAPILTARALRWAGEVR